MQSDLRKQFQMASLLKLTQSSGFRIKDSELRVQDSGLIVPNVAKEGGTYKSTSSFQKLPPSVEHSHLLIAMLLTKMR